MIILLPLLLLFFNLLPYSNFLKGTTHLMAQIDNESTLIISDPHCFISNKNNLTHLHSTLPLISTGSAILKASEDAFILISSTPLSLYHLNAQCDIIKSITVISYKTEPNHSFFLSLLSNGNIFTSWSFQSHLYFALYNIITMSLDVQSYSVNGFNSQYITCEEIITEEIVCLYYINNEIMFGLFRLETTAEGLFNFISINELSIPSSIYNINNLRIGERAHMVKYDTTLIACVGTLNYAIIGFSITINPITHSLVIEHKVLANAFLFGYHYDIIRASDNQFLLFTRTLRNFITIRYEIDLSVMGDLTNESFENSLSSKIDFDKEFLMQYREIDNKLLILAEISDNENELLMQFITLFPQASELFIGVQRNAIIANLDLFIEERKMVLYSVPRDLLFMDHFGANYNLKEVLLVNKMVLHYELIGDNPDEEVNIFEGKYVELISNSNENYSIYTNFRKLSIAYCYHSCEKCFAFGNKSKHNCSICLSGYNGYKNKDFFCYNDQTKPLHSFFNTETELYDDCDMNCYTCNGKDINNHYCTECNSPQIIQPKGYKNCVNECESALRWYVDVVGLYHCTTDSFCPLDYKHYNPITNECLITCLLEGKLYYAYECIEECPIDTYEYKGLCVRDCNGKLGIEPIDGKCINCAIIDYLNFEGKCISKNEQPDNTFLSDLNYNILSQCFEIDPITNEIKSYYGIEEECRNPCPDSYYFNNINSLCYKCYEKCKKCSQAGNNDKHNCNECIEGYMMHSLRKGMCFMKCEKYWYINPNNKEIICLNNCRDHQPNDLFLSPIEDSKECLTDCPPSYVIYDNKCLMNCPDSTMIIHNFKCFLEGTPPLDMEDNWEDIFNKDNSSLGDYFEDFPIIFPSIYEDDNYTIQVMNPKNETAKEEAIKNNLSTINFTQCDIKLREHYKLPIDKQIYVLKIDIKEDPEATVPLVKYKAFDYKGNELDLSVCDGIEIEIDYPIINDKNLNLDQAEHYSKDGIDVYSKQDPFFNNLCYPYTAEGDKDIPINDRRTDIYQNASLCQPGCSYKSIDYNTTRVTCDCNVAINSKNDSVISDDELLKNELFGEVFDIFSSSTIMVVTCYKLVFQLKTIIRNIGFWLFAFFTIILTILFVLFPFCGLGKLYALLNRYPKNNHANNIETQRKNNVIETPIHAILPSPPVKSSVFVKKNNTLHQRTITNTIKLDDDKDNNDTNYYYYNNYQRNHTNDNNNYINSNGKEKVKESYHNQISAPIMESNDLLCTPQQIQKQSNHYHHQLKSSKSFHNNLCNNDTYIGGVSPLKYITSLNSHKKLLSISKKPTDIYLDSSKTNKKAIQEIDIKKDTNNKDFIIITTAQKKFTIATPLKLINDDKIIQPPSTSKSSDFDAHDDFDSLEIEEAMIKDKRSLCRIYWDGLKTDQMIISLFANKSPFAPWLIRFSLFIFTMSLFFSMNALLFNDKHISSRYHSNEKLNLLYLIKNEITKCIYSSLITSVVTAIFVYLFSNYNLRKLIKDECDRDLYIDGVQKGISALKGKMYFFIVVSMMLMLFCWYYVTAFCAVYRNNAISWIEGSMITFGLSNLIGFILLFVSALLRYFANKMKWWCMFKVSLYVKGFAT